MNYYQVEINPSAKIAGSASIVGNVKIGKDTTIFFNATIRGDDDYIVVGDRSNVQENSCLHVSKGFPCIVGNDVTVGHGAILHGATIGDCTIIGMGAIVLDGAQVGKNCLIGAGALVVGGSVIPEGMLAVGSPAKAKRPLTDDELRSLQVSAEEYVEVGCDLVENGVLRSAGDLQSEIKAITLK